MLPHLWTTLRLSLRAPSTWVLALLGVLSALVGLSLSILALGEVAATGGVLLRESAHTTGAVTALWALALLHELDARSGFTAALDCTRPGILGRRAGRVGGSAVAALLATLPVVLVGQALLDGGWQAVYYLLFTTICSTLLVLAWGNVLLLLTGSGQAALLGGLMLWVAGHLPWGQPSWGGDGWGRVTAALLPGGGPGSEALAACGLLALGAAFSGGSARRA